MMRHATVRRAITFCALVRHRTLVAAAREIGRSPPAVHHEIKQLEQDLGQPLFAKVGRHLQPTARARLLYEEWSKSFGDIDRSERCFRERAANESHRIACVSGFGRYRLAPDLLRRAPANESIELYLGSHDDCLQALVNGRVDVAVTYKPVVSVPLETAPFAEERLVLIVPAGVPTPGSVDEWGGIRLITYDEYEYVFGRWFAAVLGRQPARLRTGDHMSELDEALVSVAEGRGATIAPEDAWDSVNNVRTSASVRGPKVKNDIYVLRRAGADPRTHDFLRGLFT